MVNTNNLKNEFLEILEEVKVLNKFMYENPELGLEEFKARDKHCELLSKYGFDIQKGHCGFETAFVGSYESEKKGPTIAYLAEYDALPEIGHGCGHNILGATSTAAAILLKKYVEMYGGKVLAIGTPAEETFGGKIAMANSGAFDEIDVAMAVHPKGNHNHVRSGSSQAMDALKFTFKGRTAHAAGSPHLGINALDGVITLFNAINALRQQILGTDRIHGIISNGGEAANIIPDLAAANFYVRSETKEDLEKLRERVLNCAKGAAMATGTTLEVENYETSFLNLITNKTLMGTYEKSLNEIGIYELHEPTNFGSTDAGDVSHVCPTIHPYFPLYKDAISHSVDMANATIEAGAYKGMEEAVLALVMTGIKVLTDEKLLDEIKTEFNKK